MFTADLVIQNARDILQDDAGVRYSDASLLRALTMAVFDLRRARPDYFIGTYDSSLTSITDLQEVVPLPDELMPAFAKYVAGWAEMRDDEYTADGRAATLMKTFNLDIGSV